MEGIDTRTNNIKILSFKEICICGLFDYFPIDVRIVEIHGFDGRRTFNYLVKLSSQIHSEFFDFLDYRLNIPALRLWT